jgi:simple sugar transport system ATP-binding protein
MSDLFLSMHGVSKRFVGVQALDSVDFEIRHGEIHCLIGENGSGKSTLIKIISGAEQPDDGATITVDGESIHDYHAIDSIRRGVAVIYQDLSLFPNLAVAENIALSKAIASGSRFVNGKAIRSIASDAMGRIGISLALDELVGELSVADQQLVAICRALTHDVKLVIMDEPTASLTRREVDSLFAVVQEMQTKGIATLFVSHKLDEVLQIAERVTILRDGKKVGTFASQEVDDEKLTVLMTGAAVEQSQFRVQPGKELPLLLDVRGLGKAGNFADISFTVRRGEILGITGLLGSGRTELALALFGDNPADSGQILLEGQPVTIGSVQAAVDLGIGYVPEDRLKQGLIMPQSVSKNIVVTILDRLVGRLGLLDDRQTRNTAESWIRELTIKTSSAESPVQTLSGGNQQRVVVAKWLATQPRLLILDGPTIGVDVAAKSALHGITRQLAGDGMGIILISDEVPEVYYNCNRVIVMHKGRFLAEFDTAQAAMDEIQRCIDTAP